MVDSTGEDKTPQFELDMERSYPYGINNYNSSNDNGVMPTISVFRSKGEDFILIRNRIYSIDL